MFMPPRLIVVSTICSIPNQIVSLSFYVIELGNSISSTLGIIFVLPQINGYESDTAVSNTPDVTVILQ
jgi:hypothetical protein